MPNPWSLARNLARGWLSGAGSTVANSVQGALRSGGRVIRDSVVVPAIDAGLQSGLLEPQIGMFGRYLTGTSKPLESLPPAVRSAIRGQMPAYRADRENWRGPDNFDVRVRPTGRGDMGTAYAPGVPSQLQNTLGQFSVVPGDGRGPTVIDKYRFDGLVDASNGGNAAMNTIRLAQQLGFIRKDFGSGYDIRAPF